jgi:ribonuclease PH
MNVVMTDGDRLVEVQGTAEHGTFDRKQLDALIDLATGGIRQLVEAQKKALDGAR